MAQAPPRPPAATPQRRGAQTANRAQVQADVFAATAKLLAGGSAFADLSVQRIAHEAGISRTAFYFYFADKRELITGLAADISQQLYDRAARFFSGEADSEAELRTVLGEVYELYRRHGAVTRAIVEVSTYDEEIAVYWRGLLDAFVSATEQRIVRERAAAGRTGAGRSGDDPRAIAFALVWMLERTLYQQLVQDEPVPRKRIIEALVHIFQGAI